MTVLHRVSLVGFGAFERTTFDLFFRMSEQRARREPSSDPGRPRRERGYLHVAPADHPDLVLVNGDAAEAVRQAWRWPGRCICIGSGPFAGAIAHLPRPVHMATLLGVLDDLVRDGRPARERARAAGYGQAPSRELGPPARVLVVDDNENTLRSIRRFLRRLGVVAVFARNGEEALYRVSQADFELVLLDSRMPGISGFLTSRLIKTRPYREGQAPPRVVLLAWPEDALDPLRTLLSRCDLRLDKPIRKPALLPLVQPLAQQLPAVGRRPAP